MSYLNDAAVQAAVYSLLAADEDLTETLPQGAGSIASFAVPGLVFPYVLIAGIDSRDAGTQAHAGRDSRITIEVYSRLPGGDEARSLAGLVASALTDTALDLGGDDVILQRVEGCRTALLADGQTYRSTLDLRVVSEHLY